MNPFTFLLSRIEQPPTGQVHKEAARFLAAGAEQFPMAAFDPASENAAKVALAIISPSTTTARDRNVRRYIELLGADGVEA